MMKTKREEKSKMLKKIKSFAAVILAIVMIFGLNQSGFVSSVQAEGSEIVIKASDLNKAFIDSSSPYAEYVSTSSGSRDLAIHDYNGRDVRIIMDQALSVDTFWANYSNVTITGNSILRITNTSQFGKNLTLEKGSHLLLDGQYAKIRVLYNIYSSGLIEMNDAYRICSVQDFNLLDGEISGNAINNLIESENGNINIDGGEITASSTKNGLYSTKKAVTINGGLVDIQCSSGNAIYANTTFSFNGGELKAKSSATAYDRSAVVAGNGITISDNCFIKVPDNGTVGTCGVYKCIADSTGTKAGSVTLKEAINLNKATVTGIVDKDYTGSPITQDITVTYNNTVLRKDYHYTVSYENNINGGTATIHIDSIHENDVSGNLTKTFKIIKHEHTVVIDPAVPATCQKTGLTQGSHCSTCNVVIKKQEVTPIIDHNYQVIPGTAKTPTCTESGKEADKECTMCHNKLTGKTINASGHHPVILPRVEPTTTSTGLTEGKQCSVCGYYFTRQEVIPMIDNTCHHIWNQGVVTKEATCIEGGEVTYTCSLCNGTMTEPTNPLGHNKVTDTYVPPTTTSTGLTEGSHCSRCHIVFEAQEEIPMLEPETPAEGGSDGTDDKKDDSVVDIDPNKDKNTNKNSNQNSNQNKNQNNNNNQNSKTNKPTTTTPTYSNEWVNGKWYNANGVCDYAGTLSWKSDATGWWVEDSEGWYPTDSWQKIDGTWYYFKPNGYMAMNEYFNGYWFNADGSWSDQYYLTWKSDATGWWVEDVSGWWPSNSWLKIDGYWYYFDGTGYMVTNQYVDGWWIGADGICW